MIDEDWGGFAAAFTEAASPARSPGGNGRRLFAIAVVGLLALAISALMYGAFGKSGGAPAGVAGAGWTAVAGPTCDAPSTGFTAVGYSSAPVGAQTTGWTTSESGGYVGSGCAGGFMSMPLSGKPTAYDDSRTALWDFEPGPQYVGAACRLSFYVPAAAAAFVGGHPADYYIYGAHYAAGSTAAPLGTFQVDQVSRRGSWAAGPAFHATSAKVTVRLIDAGLDLTAATKDAHAAVAQVRLTCGAA
jgi:translation initiation factor IF-2